MEIRESVEAKRSVKDGKFDLRVFIRLIVERLMGESLDLFKISGISDRAMEQVSRTIKRDYNSVINQSVAILESQGYIEPLTDEEAARIENQE